MHVNKRKFKWNNKGFTLIELMVTVILVALVLTTVYGMITAGNRIFAQGDAKADVQSSLRVSANFISDQIRYASNVKILDSLPVNFTSDTKQYIYEDGGILKYYDGHTISNVPGVLDGVIATLDFEDKNSQTVLIRINGTLRNQSYEVETAAYLLNIGSSALAPVASGDGKVIEFLPGIPINSNINARPITAITIKTDPVGITETTPNGQVAFAADVSPADASRKAVEWFLTSHVTYAAIESTSATTGILKFNGAAAGNSVTVKARAMDGSGVVSNFPVTITVTDAAVVTGTLVEVTSDYNNIFQKGGRLQMKAIVTPESASTLGVNWSLNVDSSVATINSEGVLETNSLNSSNGTIVVTATLTTGESGSKVIQIIENIDSISLNQTSGTTTGNGANTVYSTKVKCLINPGSKSVTLSNGVTAIDWTVTGNNSGRTITLIKNTDGSVDVQAKGHQNSTGSFNLTATITPISGAGKIALISIIVP